MSTGQRPGIVWDPAQHNKRLAEPENEHLRQQWTDCAQAEWERSGDIARSCYAGNYAVKHRPAQPRVPTDHWSEK